MQMHALLDSNNIFTTVLILWARLKLQQDGIVWSHLSLDFILLFLGGNVRRLKANFGVFEPSYSIWSNFHSLTFSVPFVKFFVPFVTFFVRFATNFVREHFLYLCNVF